jgi:hypothetical protein
MYANGKNVAALRGYFACGADDTAGPLKNAFS